MCERIIVRILDNLPYGQDHVWFRDLNILALSSRLDCDGRQRVIEEVIARWRGEVVPLLVASA